MPFETITKFRNSKPQELRVVFGVGGVIFLNTFTMRSYFSNYKYAEFLYDKDTKTLAIKPVLKAGDNSYNLAYSSRVNKTTGVIAARAVTKMLNISDKKKTVYPADWNSKEGFLEVKI